MFLINVQNQLRLIESQQVQNNQLLAQLNGGVLLEVSDTAFPSNTINTWNEFELALDSLHPEIQKLALEELMVNTQLKLSRSQWMPNLMLGYESEEVLSEKFQGIKAGISMYSKRVTPVKICMCLTSNFNASAINCNLPL